jgi:hypothetical protein
MNFTGLQSRGHLFFTPLFTSVLCTMLCSLLDFPDMIIGMLIMQNNILKFRILLGCPRNFIGSYEVQRKGEMILFFIM